MSRPGQPFIPLIPPKDQRPRANFFGPAATHNLLRDQLTISTWLCLGAALQGTLFILLGRPALLPALSLLLFCLLKTYMIATGWLHNTYMDGVIPKKFSAQFPDETGTLGPKPSDSDVVVFIIGARSNYPLGLLAPGFKQTGDYFLQMSQDLSTHAEEFGLLGQTSYFNASDRSTSSEIMTVCYFRTTEQLHAFAHSSYHREGWNWFNKSVKEIPHISIYHETYHVPKGHWENIYVNSHASGITSSTFQYFDKEQGKEMWASGIVDASKGLLKTSAGRMSRSHHANEHEKYGEDPY